ncbi:MAG: SH3 domain-containing protein [Microcoleus sp. SIO2G3]|nr:SH3 domain-containing protein [Microcoleus sp. SIO2G3]
MGRRPAAAAPAVRPARGRARVPRPRVPRDAGVQLTRAESPQGVEFQGTGWIYSQLLGTSTRGYGSGGVSVYQSANTQSATIGRIPEQTSVKLLSCDRTWALVEYKGLKGWIAPEAQCPSPLTTCS